MIHLEVLVDETATLLAPEAYDAGALLRWEWSATVDGIYVEAGTLPLVADVSLYDIWDSNGVVGTTWYRTRVSDAGGTTFSAYSAPFQTAGNASPLSVDQFRAFVTTSLSDEALLILLDAAAESIVQCAGPVGETNELLSAQGDLLMLSRPAVSIGAVIEHRWTPVTLDPTDYELRASRQTLRRLSSGANPAHGWGGRVNVTYTPLDDMASRQRVQRALVMLDLDTKFGGLASQRIGEWAESYATGSGAKSYDEQRDDILASLSPGIGIA